MTGDRSAWITRLFRPEALERLRTPEPLDRLVTFAPSATWLGALGRAWLVAWAVLLMATGW